MGGVDTGLGPGSLLADLGHLSAERAHVRADADAAVEGVGPHHRAAGHGPRRRVQGGLQGGEPGLAQGVGAWDSRATLGPAAAPCQP